MLNRLTKVHAATMYKAVRGRSQGSLTCEVPDSKFVATVECIDVRLPVVFVGGNALDGVTAHLDPEPIDHTSGRPTKMMWPSACIHQLIVTVGMRWVKSGMKTNDMNAQMNGP